MLSSSMNINQSSILSQNCNGRLKTIIKIRKILDQSQITNNMMLINLDTSINDNMLLSIAKWMFGSTLNRKKLKYSTSNDPDLTILTIPLLPSLTINLHIISNQQYRILILNLSTVQNINQQNAKDLFEIIFALNVIKNKINKDDLIFYCTINGNYQQNKINNKIAQAKEFMYHDNLRFIMCDYQKQQEEVSQINKILIDGQQSNPEFTLSLQQIFGEEVQKFDGIGNFISKVLEDENFTFPLSQSTIKKDVKKDPKAPPSRKKLIQQKLRNVIKQVTYTIRQSLLNYIPQIIQNTLSQTQKNNKKIFNNQLQKIKQLFQYIQYNYYQQQQHQNNNKSDQQLAYKYFTIKTMELKFQYQNIKPKQKTIEKLEEFFNKFFSQLSKIPQLNQSQVKLIHQYITLIIQQNTIVQQLSPKISPMFNSILDALKINQNPKTKISQIVSKLVLKYPKPCSYYDIFSLMIQKTYETFKQNELKNCDKMINNFKQLKKQLPIFKNLYILKQQNQPTKIIKTIKQILSIHFKDPKYYQFKFLHLLFLAIGDNLEKFNLYQLAIEIYKRLKLDHKITICLDHIIEQNPSNKSTIYQQITTYYQQIGFSNYAYKFAQLAYQSVNNLQQSQTLFTKMLSLKKKLMTNQNSQLNLINQILQKKNHQLSYLTYHFSTQFKNKINKLQTLILQQQK